MTDDYVYPIRIVNDEAGYTVLGHKFVSNRGTWIEKKIDDLMKAGAYDALTLSYLGGQLEAVID
jgi:hypothetical protein